MNYEQTVAEASRMMDILEHMPSTPTAADLLVKEFPPVKWVVPGLIPTGLTILAGAPKLGKSWLVLNMAWSLAVGGRILGHIKVDPTEVMLLALEDTERRLKDRLGLIGSYGSSKFFLPTQWPTGDAALQYLEIWMIEHPDTRAIFIDTLQRISGIEDPNNYRETYGAAASIKQFADKHDLGVVVVHHTRKMQANDFLHTVAGSVGLTGAADTIITMTRMRGKAEGIMSITGRDVEETKWGIRFDSTIGTWEKLDYLPKEESHFRTKKAS